MNKPGSDGVDWDAVDCDVVAENYPLKLNEGHLEKLCLRHGEKAGTDKFLGAIDGALRKTRIIPPSRNGGR